LLGCEDRSGKKYSGDIRYHRNMEQVWLHFGGKRESYENHPSKTAIREFNEETGGIFSDKSSLFFEKLNKSGTIKLWYPPGKYVLYFLEISYDEDIPFKFQKINRSERSELDQVSIKWINVGVLLAAIATGDSTFPLTLEEVGTAPNQFYKFFMDMMSTPGIGRFLLTRRPSDVYDPDAPAITTTTR